MPKMPKLKTSYGLFLALRNIISHRKDAEYAKVIKKLKEFFKLSRNSFMLFLFLIF